MNAPENIVIPRFARAGYIAKGTTYLLMGFLAFRSAFGQGSAANTRRALAALNGPLVGRIAVALVAAGLGAYALWRIYVAIANPEDDGVLQRIGIGAAGLVNAGIAVQAALLALHAGSREGTDQAAHWSEVVMRYPYGSEIVMLAGASLALYGCWQIIRAIRAKLDSALQLAPMKRDLRKAAVTVSRFGIAARGLVFILLGLFIIDAARDADPADAKDFGHTLQTLHEKPYGALLLGSIAIGLLAYALYEFVRARYRIIQAR
jgi:hypothetical protein